MRSFAILTSLALTINALSALPANASENSKDGRRVKVVKDGVGVIIEAYSDDIIHVEVSTQADKQSVDKPIFTSAMVGDPALKPAMVMLRENGLSTSRLDVSVDPNRLCVTVTDKTRSRIIERNCPFNTDKPWKGITLEANSIHDVYGLGNYFRTVGTADGNWVGGAWDPLADSFGNSMRPFAEGAPSYAMFPISYFLGDGKDGFAHFMDQTYKQMWSFNTSPWRIEMWGDQMRWYVIRGANLQELRKSYMQLTGRPPMPPKKVLGLWVSEFGYENWDEAFKPVVSLRSNGFPLDGLGMDLQWFGGKFYPNGADTRGSRMGTLQFDPTNFGNFAHQVKHLRDDRGVSLMAIEESYVSKFLPEHEQLARQQFLAHNCSDKSPVFLTSNPWWGVGGMIDWSNPKAGDYWHDLKRQPLYNLGITAHWTDLGEPEMFDSNACYYGIPELGLNKHGDIHNIYNLKWLESIANGYKRNHNRVRPYMMARSGTSGIQRFGAGMWTGDLGANMNSMRAHYNAHMHLSLSGIDYLSSDIGGFHRRPETLDGDANELYTQWFANASLFDFPIRPHVWNLGNNLKTSPDEIGNVASNRFNIHQRYALSPYYYSLAYQASANAVPVVPPLVYYFQDDRNVRPIANQKMIGPFLMGAMVAQYGETERSVYLPKGKWYNFHTDQSYDSTGQSFSRIPEWEDRGNNVWIFRAPLFAKAGSLIPMMHVDNSTMNILGKRPNGEAPRTDLRLRVYPGEFPSASSRSSFTLYEDDGETIDYRQNKYALTELEQIRSGSSVRIQIHATRGSYQGFPTSRDHLIEVILDDENVNQVSLNGMALRRLASRDEFPASPNGFFQNGRKLLIKTGTLPVTAEKTVDISLAPAR